MMSCSWDGARVLAVVLFLSVVGAGAFAQVASDPAEQHPEAAERAQREADKVFKWILIHAEKPKRTEAKPAEAKAAEAKVAVPAKPVARAKAEGTTEHATAAKPAAETAKAIAAAPSVEKTDTHGTASVARAEAAATASSAQQSPALALATPTSPARIPIATIPAPDAEEEEEPLVVVKQVDPEFPDPVMRRLQTGSVQVRFEVRPDGSVRPVEVVKSINKRLNAAAMDAVAQWQFKPLKRAQYGVVELAFDMRWMPWRNGASKR